MPLRFRVRDLRPRNRRVLRNPLIHQLLHVAHLLRRERLTREVESQLLRPDVTALLYRLLRIVQAREEGTRNLYSIRMLEGPQ